MNACACGAPAQDAFLCRGCSQRLERALGDLPALIADLDITLTRQAVTGAHTTDGGKPAKKDSQPSPLHIGAAAVAFELRSRLMVSVKWIGQAHTLTLPTEDPSTMARWLLRYHRHIVTNKAGPDIASDIHGITATIHDVIDLPKSRGRFKVGNCPELDEDGVLCPGEVWVDLPAEDLGKTATMECRACGKVWETWQWHRAGMRILKRGAA